MEEKPCKCLDCEKREQEEKESHELNFSVLVALVPMLTLTLLGNLGLF